MKEVVKKELRELCDSFDKASIYEIGCIFDLFDYLNNAVPKDYDISRMYQDVSMVFSILENQYNAYFRLRKNKIDSFMKKNQQFFNYSIEKHQARKRYPEGRLSILSFTEVVDIIEDFLKSISLDLWQFYLKMVEEGRIIISFNNAVAHTSLNNSNTIIFIESLQNLNDIMIFIHELAHAYYAYFNDTRARESDNILVELKEEIPAKVLEMKFIKYLENNDYKESTILENVFNKYMDECNKKRNNFEYLKYLIAANIAHNIKNIDIDLNSYYKYLYEKDIFRIVNGISNEVRLGEVSKK